MKPIGGYFGLELPISEEYHKSAIRLNTGRNAFEYVLRAKRYKKVYLPYYICDVMLEPVYKLELTYEFYNVDDNLSPLLDFKQIQKNEVVVYINYFGICDIQISEIAKRCNNLIIDNSQSFFSKPLPGVDTFYSARKFFGVPDGAYLYTDKPLTGKFEQDVSYNRFEHLLGRIDLGAEKFYNSFKKNDEALKNQPIKAMSKLTKRILQSIDYEDVIRKRRKNFSFLHENFKSVNLLNFTFGDIFVPMVYPLLLKNGSELKKILIEHKIFVATYWPNVREWVKNDSFENKLANQLVVLPIDQRYYMSEMKRIKPIYLEVYKLCKELIESI